MEKRSKMSKAERAKEKEARTIFRYLASDQKVKKVMDYLEAIRPEDLLEHFPKHLGNSKRVEDFTTVLQACSTGLAKKNVRLPGLDLAWRMGPCFLYHGIYNNPNAKSILKRKSMHDDHKKRKAHVEESNASKKKGRKTKGLASGSMADKSKTEHSDSNDADDSNSESEGDDEFTTPVSMVNGERELL